MIGRPRFFLLPGEPRIGSGTVACRRGQRRGSAPCSAAPKRSEHDPDRGDELRIAPDRAPDPFEVGGLQGGDLLQARAAELPERDLRRQGHVEGGPRMARRPAVRDPLQRAVGIRSPTVAPVALPRPLGLAVRPGMVPEAAPGRGRRRVAGPEQLGRVEARGHRSRGRIGGRSRRALRPGCPARPSRGGLVLAGRAAAVGRSTARRGPPGRPRARAIRPELLVRRVDLCHPTGRELA